MDFVTSTGTIGLFVIGIVDLAKRLIPERLAPWATPLLALIAAGALAYFVGGTVGLKGWALQTLTATGSAWGAHAGAVKIGEKAGSE